MIGERSYDGDPIDWTWQYIGERPELDEEAEDVAYATDPDGHGEERTVGEPVIDRSDRKRRGGSKSDQDSNSRCRDGVSGRDGGRRSGRVSEERTRAEDVERPDVDGQSTLTDWEPSGGRDE